MGSILPEGSGKEKAEKQAGAFENQARQNLKQESDLKYQANQIKKPPTVPAVKHKPKPEFSDSSDEPEKSNASIRKMKEETREGKKKLRQTTGYKRKCIS